MSAGSAVDVVESPIQTQAQTRGGVTTAPGHIVTITRVALRQLKVIRPFRSELVRRTNEQGAIAGGIRQQFAIPKRDDGPSPIRVGRRTQWKSLKLAKVKVQSDPDLTKIALARGLLAGGFGHGQCGQEQSRQDGDDRDDHQEFNEGKRISRRA